MIASVMATRSSSGVNAVISFDLPSTTDWPSTIPLRTSNAASRCTARPSAARRAPRADLPSTAMTPGRRLARWGRGHRPRARPHRRPQRAIVPPGAVVRRAVLGRVCGWRAGAGGARDQPGRYQLVQRLGVDLAQDPADGRLAWRGPAD